MLMSWMVSGENAPDSCDEHEVVGERWFVVLWVLDGEVGFYHLTAWFLVGLKTVQAQPMV